MSGVTELIIKHALMAINTAIFEIECDDCDTCEQCKNRALCDAVMDARVYIVKLRRQLKNENNRLGCEKAK